MPVRRLPDNPSLEHLRNQAKRLRRAVRAADATALELVAEFHPRPLPGLAARPVEEDPRPLPGFGARPAGSPQAGGRPRPPEGFTLADAQLTVARAYGFASWPRLRAHLDVLARHSRSPHLVPESADPVAEFLRLACLPYGNDDPSRRREAARALALDPGLAVASVHTMAATGQAEAMAAALAADPAGARAEGGPYRWEPLLYLAYSRVEGGDAVETARLLLEHGADPDAGYLWEGLPSPFTALTGAFGGGERGEPPHPRSTELARLLLEAGADPNDGQTLYNRGLGASGADDTEHLELLFEYGLGRGDGGPWHRRLGPAHATPERMLQDEVLAATMMRRPRRLRLLIEHGAGVDGPGAGHPLFEGRTPYELAVLGGNVEAAAMLAKAGATGSLDEVDLFLGACMRAERLDVAPGLVARAVERMPHLVNRAAAHGNAEAVRLMASLGFEVGLVRRASPLHEAAWAGDLPMVRTLLELGADPSVRDTEFGATPLGWAEHGGRHEVAAYLASL
ncbi:ankyrin repeat domain-containing protein [Streptosporangium sp. NPDC002721]|uniref:ankyrin repeat domain-containing protein n=1 Tax=Streptosporangium sp. NPDC002721 TaxID=3366188 RepID=UPI0036C0DDA4